MLKKTVKIIIYLSVVILVGIQNKSAGNIAPILNESWTDFKLRINNYKQDGLITTSQLEYILNGYRSQFKIRDFRIEKQETSMEINFNKYSSKSLGYIKNNLYDMGIEPEKLDSVIGGLLRLFHFSKLEGSNFKINHRMNSYFTDRLQLSQKQIEYLIYVAHQYKI
jgi:hypothetical protein